MSSTGQAQQEQEEFVKACLDMYDGLRAWRERHPQASIDEIVAQVTPRRQELRGELVGQLAGQHGNGVVVAGLRCEACGQARTSKGEPKRGGEHLAGETELDRAYYYWAPCERGLFPLGRAVTVGPAQLDASNDKTSRALGDRDAIAAAGSGEF